MAFEMSKNNAQLAAELIMSELPAIWVWRRELRLRRRFSNLCQDFRIPSAVF